MEPDKTSCEVITLYNLDCNRKLAVVPAFLLAILKSFSKGHTKRFTIYDLLIA